MNNPFQLKFTLKQHTPIIHFQHDQEGATLRSTEVKPKLDQFIIERCLRAKNINFAHAQEAREKFRQQALNPENDNEKKQWKYWLVGNGNAEHVALNYKLKICTNNNISEKSINPITIITDPSYPSVNNHTVQVKIFVLDQRLQNTINRNIDAFWALENFGTRQNKAWGVFSRENKLKGDFENDLISLDLPVYVRRNFSNGDFDQNSYTNNLMLSIWRVLKSGKQYPLPYTKSKLFKYFCENNIRWDKRYFKKQLNAMIASRQLPAALQGAKNPVDCFDGENRCRDDRDDYFDQNDNNNYFTNNYRFIRALLGLAEHYEFRAQGGYTYQVKVTSDNIVRFKAPITFKIFERDLYAILNKIPNTINDAAFSFTVNIKQNNNLVRTEPLIGLGLRVPAFNEYDLEEFLDNYLIECFNFIKLNS